MWTSKWSSNSYCPFLWRVGFPFLSIHAPAQMLYSKAFWANMVFRAGAGPRPIDHKSLDVESLSMAIECLLDPSTIQAAERISQQMQHENGVKEAVNSFHRNLPFQQMNFEMIPRQPATWYWKKGKRTLKLSHRAVSILVEHKKIEVGSLKM